MPKSAETIFALSRWSVLCPALLLFFLILAGSIVSFAQADVSSSTLKGRVTDHNGDSIAGVTVSAVNGERGLTRTTMTDDDGIYRIPLLQPGTYEIRISAKGFGSQIVSGAVLTIGQIAVRDFQLQIGQVEEKIEVGQATPLIDIERTQQSDTVERRQIETLPNFSRNFTSYIFTLPGVADVAAASVQQSRVIPIATSGFSVGAGNGRSNYVSIDGGENDSGTGNLRIRNLSVEAVQEFQVNRNAYAAEYGFTAGTAVNVDHPKRN